MTSDNLSPIFARSHVFKYIRSIEQVEVIDFTLPVIDL